MSFLYLLTGLATATCLYLYFTRTFNYWRSRNVVTPTPVPLFGNLMESTLRREPMMVVMKKIYDAFPDEKLVGVYRMTAPDLLIRDPAIIKYIMIKDFDNFPDRGIEFDKDGLGMNLFHADEKIWRILRNKFSPLFTSSKLKLMLHLISDKGDNFIKHIENLTRSEPEQDMCQLVQRYTIVVLAACAFGLDIDTTKDNDIFDTLNMIDKKLFNVNYAHELDMMYPGILNKFGSSLFPTIVSKFFHEVVKQIMTERKGVPTDRKDFMDFMLELKQHNELDLKMSENKDEKTLEITEVVMAAQAFVFYGAGYETSSATLGFMFMLLALNPDVQDKVAAEIKEVLKCHDDKITYDALKDMVYLERVFYETLRMFPIADPILRRVGTDYRIPGTDVTLKKGQILLVSLNGLHNDEKYWPNPSKFDPDRFSPENTAKRDSAVYLPFGIGRRNCIGMRFAKMQSRVCAVKILQRFRLEPTDHTRRNFQFDPHRVVLSPIGGMKIKFVPRE